MCWITAAVGAVEKAIAACITEAARPEVQTRPADMSLAGDSSSCNVSTHGESAAETMNSRKPETASFPNDSSPLAIGSGVRRRPITHYDAYTLAGARALQKYSCH
jgi:hypothetical protein